MELKLKKTILVVGDAIEHSSGVGNQLRHVVNKLLLRGYDVVTIGVINSQKIPEPKTYELPAGVALIYYSNAYDDIALYDYIIKTHGVNAMVLMTDPYRYMRYFQYAYMFRQRLPVYYISVWDTHLAPIKGGKYHFNLPLYESFDAIGVISHQTFDFTERVLSDSKQTRLPVVDYVGHGSDPQVFKPLEYNEYHQLRNHLFRGMNPEFVVMLNSRNQNRKKIPDLIEAFRLFNQTLHPEKQNRVALLLQTELVSEYGTNLIEVCASQAPDCPIFINTDRVPESVLNMMYNSADIVVNISNAEGFGLSANEAILAGKPVILNKTGGLKDQGNGPWCKYVEPQRTIIGNPTTPYLYDENVSIDDVAVAIREWYDTPIIKRTEYGLMGRQAAIDHGLTSNSFSDRVADGIENMIHNFVSVDSFNIYKV